MTFDHTRVGKKIGSKACLQITAEHTYQLVKRIRNVWQEGTANWDYIRAGLTISARERMLNRELLNCEWGLPVKTQEKGPFTNNVSKIFGIWSPPPCPHFGLIYITKNTQPPLLRQNLGNLLHPPICWRHLWMARKLLNVCTDWTPLLTISFLIR